MTDSCLALFTRNADFDTVAWKKRMFNCSKLFNLIALVIYGTNTFHCVMQWHLNDRYNYYGIEAELGIAAGLGLASHLYARDASP